MCKILELSRLLDCLGGLAKFSSAWGGVRKNWRISTLAENMLPKPYFAKGNFNKTLLFVINVLYNTNKVQLQRYYIHKGYCFLMVEQNN